MVFERFGSTTAPATVHFTTRNLTATAGKDYIAQFGTVTFAPLEVEKTITIPVLADNEEEFDEDFEVVVTAAEGFEALPAPLRLTILDKAGRGPASPLDRIKRLHDGSVLLGGNSWWTDRKIEFSSDLKTWQPLTNFLGAADGEGTAIWLDASATNASSRFYRAVAR